MNRIRVFLVDDHSIVRNGLRLLIEREADMAVVGESSGERSLVDQLLRIERPDVIILDISMPQVSGLKLAAEIRAAIPNVKILALSRHGEKAYVQQMLQAGATGYVLKQTPAEVLITAIRAVAGGATYLDSAISSKLVDSLAGARSSGSARNETLTPREQEIVTLVAYGHTNKEIASSLGITVKTVETHKTNIMQKLEIPSRAGLVRFALERGWLER